MIFDLELDAFEYEEITTFTYTTWLVTLIELQALFDILIWLFSFLALSYNGDSYSYSLMQKLFGKKDEPKYPFSNQLDKVLTEKQQLILRNR